MDAPDQDDAAAGDLRQQRHRARGPEGRAPRQLARAPGNCAASLQPNRASPTHDRAMARTPGWLAAAGRRLRKGPDEALQRPDMTISENSQVEGVTYFALVGSQRCGTISGPHLVQRSEFGVALGELLSESDDDLALFDRCVIFHLAVEHDRSGPVAHRFNDSTSVRHLFR